MVAAYFDCRRTKRNTHTALAFEADLERNLRALYDELAGGTYLPGRSICFVVTRPRPRDQCAAAGVPFFFKQWGAWWPISQMPDGVSDGFYDPKYGEPERDEYDKRPAPRAASTTVLQLDGHQEFDFPPGAMTCFKVGKKAAGRLLDGVEHSEYPA